jgi:hypothetical protein
MLPSHRQPRAPRPKAFGNAFQALVDPPNDGNNLSLDGGDGIVDGTDERGTVNMPQHASAVETTAATSPQQTPTGDPPLHIWHRGLIADVVNAVLHDVPMPFAHEQHFQYCTASLCAIEQANVEIQRRLNTFEDNVYNSFEHLLQRMDAAWTENTALREAYRTSREETAALKPAIDTLTQKIDEQLTIPAPPSPDLLTSPTTMEEMTVQLSVIQHDIKDILETVRNPPVKRKRCTSNQNVEPTMPTNR